jgi:hypothetical protein
MGTVQAHDFIACQTFDAHLLSRRRKRGARNGLSRRPSPRLNTSDRARNYEPRRFVYSKLVEELRADPTGGRTEPRKGLCICPLSLISVNLRKRP